MGKKTYSLIFMLFAVIVCAGFLNSAATAAQQVTTQQVATQQPAKAKNTATRLTYSVYAGGVYVLAATLDISQKSGLYGLDLRAQTLGILGNLAPWSGEFKTRGVSQKAPLPLTYRSASVWKGETETKTYRYDGAGHFKSYQVTQSKLDPATKKTTVIDTTPAKIDPLLTRNTTDILSAAWDVMLNLPGSQECAGESLIFDGDRSFKLKFHSSKPDMLAFSKYNLYHGSTVSCQVEIIPAQGKWRKKPRGWLSIQEQGRQKGALPTIWFAPLKGGNYYVPVKIVVHTDYGPLIMHLSGAVTK